MNPTLDQIIDAIHERLREKDFETIILAIRETLIENLMLNHGREPDGWQSQILEELDGVSDSVRNFNT